MKQMNIINNKKAMTTIEITISLALILLFLFMIFPSLKLTLKLENYFISEEKLERNSSRVIEMLEKEIEDSSFGVENYIGRENLINGKGIYNINANKIFPTILNEEFFKNKKEKGNVLFLEIPYVKNGKLYSKYNMYVFSKFHFYVYECDNSASNILIDEYEMIFEYTNGYFEWDNTGIKIVMNIKIGDKIKELKGYALKGKKK